MHTCPTCGSACYCRGDVDDIEVDAGAAEQCRHCANDDPPDDGLLGAEGCVLPGQCCMPCPHYTSECHSAEDAEQAALLSEMEALLRFDGLCEETRALITAAIAAQAGSLTTAALAAPAPAEAPALPTPSAAPAALGSPDSPACGG